jgi:ribosomal protein L37AE/L43A
MQTIERKYGLEASAFDIQTANEHPPKHCALCNKKAWYKPSVGTWVCSCGAINRGDRWIEPKP